MLRMTEKIALYHHERWDGTGYPTGLSGQAIPEVARIVGIVDVFDALTHDRVYRPAMPEEQALNIMQQGAGTHFDPLLLAMFFTRLDEIHRLMETNPDDDAETHSPACYGRIRDGRRTTLRGLAASPLFRPAYAAAA